MSAALGLMYQTYTIHVKHMGDYINYKIRPVIVDYTGEDRLFGWEHHIRSSVYQTRRSQLTMRLAYVLLIPAVPAISLIAVIPYLTTFWYWLVWGAGVFLFAVQVIAWAKDARDVLWI